MRKNTGSRSTAARLLLFTLGLVVFYGGYYWGNRHAPRISAYRALSPLEKPAPIGRIDLLDQFGNRFTAQRLTGHWDLIIFGYTGSDQATRDLLALATHATNRLAEWPILQSATRVLLVTVDPENDRPEVLKRFIDHYSPAFLALTGSPDQIRLLAGRLGVSYRRQPAGGSGEYRIDHSTSIGVIDPAGNLAGLFTGLVDAVSIASDLKQLADSYRE